MATDPQLIETFSLVARQMTLDFKSSRANIDHNGSAGTDREGILLKFLERYLPKTVVPVGSAEVVASDGSRSRQADILITDPTTPPLYLGPGGAHRIVPVECVHGVIEVKTTLSTRDLIDACEHIKSVKERPKLAMYPDLFNRSTDRYGQTWGYFPTIGTIFGFEGANLDTLGAAFSDWCADVPHELRPDSVWVLDGGALSWTANDDIYKLENHSAPGSAVRAVLPVDSIGILLPMILRMNRDYQTAFMPNWDLERYTQGRVIGSWGNVWTP